MFALRILFPICLACYQRYRKYDPAKGKLFTWILNISRNIALDKLRSKEYKVKLKTDDVAENVFISDSRYADANKPEFIGLKEMVDKLPVEQKKLIDLMYFQGYSQSEIAEELEMPLGTVKTRVRAAMITLRQLF